MIHYQLMFDWHAYFTYQYTQSCIEIYDEEEAVKGKMLRSSGGGSSGGLVGSGGVWWGDLVGSSGV